MAKKLHNLMSVLASGKKKGEKEDKKVLSKSKAAKEAHEGKDMGKPGKNFDKVAEKAEKEYGSKEAGERVAGSVFQKMRKKGDL